MCLLLNLITQNQFMEEFEFNFQEMLTAITHSVLVMESETDLIFAPPKIRGHDHRPRGFDKLTLLCNLKMWRKVLLGWGRGSELFCS